jgi:CBS domain containing-hemolysin-like protein
MVVDNDGWVRDLPQYDYFFYSLACLSLVLFAGCMSGLNVGLMSLNVQDLEWKISNGSQQERRAAQRLYTVTKHHHLTLVSVLLANAIAMEALPIMFNMMFSELLSVILSVSFVLLCSEILPQALLTGPRRLAIASKMLPIVWVVIVLGFPISYSLSKLLDCWLGRRKTECSLTVNDLKALVANKASAKPNSLLISQQVASIHSVIDLSSLKVKDLARPLDPTQVLSLQQIVTPALLETVRTSKYPQIPVVDTVTVRAVLTAKDLLAVPMRSCLEELQLTKAEWIEEDRSLLEALSALLLSGSEVLFVASTPVHVLTLQALQGLLCKSSLPAAAAFDFRISSASAAISSLSPSGSETELVSKPHGFRRPYPSLLSTSVSEDLAVFQQ